MAGKSTPSRINQVQDVETVVDNDFHLAESSEDLLPYLEEPWDEMLQINDPNVEGDHDIYGETPIYPEAAHFHPGRASGRIPQKMVKTVEDVRDAMEMLGVDRLVLNPGSNLRLGLVHHEELAAAIASAYNEWFEDNFISEGFHGSIVVAPQKPEDAVEEIRRHGEKSWFISATIPVAGTYPPLGHKQYYPLYEACEEAGIPILLHGNGNGAPYDFPLQNKALSRHMEIHTLEHPFVHMTNLTNMTTRGVFVRFPDLDFVFQEAGLGWIPFIMNRLDHQYPMKPEDAPLLEEPPSHYIRENCYFTSQPVEGTDKPDYVGKIARLIGVDNLLFASDYPHHDFDDSNALLRSLKSEFDPEEIEKVYGKTAKEIYEFQ